jgi:hypothetical protein
MAFAGKGQRPAAKAAICYANFALQIGVGTSRDFFNFPTFYVVS